MSRKRKEGEPEKLVNQFAEGQLRDALSALKQSGAEGQFNYKVARRRPGESLWKFFMAQVPTESIDDLREFCHREGGDDFEYRVTLFDAHNRRAMVSGEPVPHVKIEAKRLPTDSVVPGARTNDDELIRSKEQELSRRAKAAALKAREIELKAEERRLEREEKMAGRPRRFREDVEEEDQLFDEDGNEVIDQRRGPRRMSPRFFQQQPPYPPPWERGDRDRGRDDRSHEMMMAMMQNQTQVMIAAMNRPVEKQDDGVLVKLLPLIMGNQLKPQDMMLMMSETNKLQGEGMRTVMESASEMQKSVITQIVKMMVSEGRPDDEIDKVKRIASLVTDGLQDLTKTVLGRESILKPGQELKVPLLNRPQPQPPQPQNGTPKVRVAPVAQTPVPSHVAHPPVMEGEAPTQENPDVIPDRTEEIVKQRILAFVTIHEQEMKVGSDPAFVIEQMDELISSLPSDLTTKLDELSVADIYEELKKHQPEIVNRILAVCASDPKKMEWCEEFWNIYQNPEEEEEEGKEEPEAAAGG
jgi:hypothetical protein